MLNLLPGDKKYSGYLITYGNAAELVADTSSDSEKMVEKLREDEAGRRLGSFRRHLYGLHQPQDHSGRTF